MTLPRLSRLALLETDRAVAELQHRAALKPPTLTDDEAEAVYAAGMVDGRASACTCHVGRCPRPSHQPQYAGCGHPGVFAAKHVGGRTLTRCYRAECFESFGIASAILALTSR